MNILLDTCTFLWLVSDSPELSLNARRLFEDPSNDLIRSNSPPNVESSLHGNLYV